MRWWKMWIAMQRSKSSWSNNSYTSFRWLRYLCNVVNPGWGRFSGIVKTINLNLCLQDMMSASTTGLPQQGSVTLTFRGNQIGGFFVVNWSVFTKTSVETRGKFLAVAKHLLKLGANSVETFVETRGKPRHQAREELAACDTLMRQSYFFL